MLLSEKIRYLRKREGYSQNDMAKQLLVERQTISRWENNVTRPEAYNLELVSELFDVSFDWLLKDDYGIEDLLHHQFEHSKTPRKEVIHDELRPAGTEITHSDISVNVLLNQFVYRALEQKRLAFVLFLLTTISGLLQLNTLLFSLPFSFVCICARPNTMYKKVSRVILWIWVGFFVTLLILLATGIGMWYI
ncbi:helix-turn-helix transcriptional regulator [Alkalibacterium psychrotolerans]